MAPVAWSTPPDWQVRVAGDGLEASYYLVADVEAGTVVERLHETEFLSRRGEQEAGHAYQFKSVEDELARCRRQLQKLVRSDRIVAVPCNTLRCSDNSAACADRER